MLTVPLFPVRYMYPREILLINQLVKRKAKFLNQIKQPFILFRATTGNIGCPSSHVVTADGIAPDLQGRHHLADRCDHQWRDAGHRLRAAGAVFCHRHLSQCLRLSGLSKAGALAAALHLLCAGKAGYHLRYGLAGRCI